MKHTDWSNGRFHRCLLRLALVLLEPTRTALSLVYHVSHVVSLYSAHRNFLFSMRVGRELSCMKLSRNLANAVVWN
jgi:hypothetical protein